MYVVTKTWWDDRLRLCKKSIFESYDLGECLSVKEYQENAYPECVCIIVNVEEEGM